MHTNSRSPSDSALRMLIKRRGLAQFKALCRGARQLVPNTLS
jgi:hypothetical protein